MTSQRVSLPDATPMEQFSQPERSQESTLFTRSLFFFDTNFTICNSSFGHQCGQDLQCDDTERRMPLLPRIRFPQLQAMLARFGELDGSGERERYQPLSARTT